jgi:hypothetical protein
MHAAVALHKSLSDLRGERCVGVVDVVKTCIGWRQCLDNGCDSERHQRDECCNCDSVLHEVSFTCPALPAVSRYWLRSCAAQQGSILSVNIEKIKYLKLELIIDVCAILGPGAPYSAMIRSRRGTSDRTSLVSSAAPVCGAIAAVFSTA